MVMQGSLYKKYGVGERGAGIEGDAILNDGAHKLPSSVLPIIAGNGIALTQANNEATIAVYIALQAFAGRITTAGTTPNFGWTFYNTPAGASLTGGYARINIDGVPTNIQITEIQYNTNTFELELGMALPIAHADAFSRETFRLIDTAGNSREFAFADASTQSATYGTTNGVRFSWTLSASTQLWTANVTNAGWYITAGIGVLNYVPHIDSADNGRYLQALGGSPGWDAIQQAHLPDNIVQGLGLVRAHMGEGYGFKHLGYMMAGQGASVASVFPPAGFDAPAYAYVESEDGSDWDVAILLPDATREVVYANRNRILVNTSVHTGAGSIDYDGRSDGDDNYRDAMRSFSLTSFQSSSDDANGYTDLRIAVDIGEITDLTTAPPNLYLRITGVTDVLTIPRLTGEEANAQGSDLRDYPQYGIQYLHGENNADSISWFGRGQAILRGVSANDNTLQINFFTNSAGSQALNIKPVRGRESAGKSWESIRPPIVSDWALASNTERIPSAKIPTTGTTILQEGSGSGLSVTSTKADARSASAPTLFAPTFDLDDADKQRGLFDIEIALRFATRSDTSATGIGFDTDLKTDITLEAFHYPSVLRASTAYAVGASNGVRIQDRIAVYHGSARLGYVHAYLVKNAANELGYYLEYEADNDNVAAAAAAQNFALQSTIHASFQHEDHTPTLPAAAAYSINEVGASYAPAAALDLSTDAIGTFTFELTAPAVTLTGDTFITLAAAGAGTDYFTLPAGVYAIDLHCEYTSGGAVGQGGARAHPEMFIERSSDGGSVWTEIQESRQGGYKKRTTQSRATINFTSSVHIVSAADERFRMRYARWYQTEATTGITETLTGQILIIKLA